ncbi:hypothetical protein COCNU_scaffold000006G000030 [Cocos nucifera]|nr:hypothetical protein [Cocos nucifera]
MRRVLLQVVLPISVISFLFYYCSCFPCSLQSIKLSFTATLGQFISKKAFFLLSNFILLFLAIDFNLCGSSAFMNNLCDEYLVRFGNHVVSQSDGFPAKPHIVEDKIVMEQSLTNNIYDDLFIQDYQLPFYEKYRWDATSGVRTLDVFQGERDANKLSQGWLVLDDQPWQSNSTEVEDAVEEKNTDGSTRDLEVVVVKEVITEEVKPVGGKDEFDLLSIDELNHMFEEFIKRERRKRRLEALQLVMV